MIIPVLLLVGFVALALWQQRTNVRWLSIAKQWDAIGARIQRLAGDTVVIPELGAQTFGPWKTPPSVRFSYHVWIKREGDSTVEVQGYVIDGTPYLYGQATRFEPRAAPFGAPAQVIGHFGVRIPVRLTDAEIEYATSEVLRRENHRASHTYEAWKSSEHATHGGRLRGWGSGDFGPSSDFLCGCGEEFRARLPPTVWGVDLPKGSTGSPS